MNLLKIMPLLFLVACQNPEMKVRAKQNTFGYHSPDATLKNADFIIEQGQICFLGQKVYGKVDRFIEIRCENGAKGLIWEENDFEIIQ